MTKLTIKQLKDMFIGGGISIANEFEYINQLNIFPVPDLLKTPTLVILQHLEKLILVPY